MAHLRPVPADLGRAAAFHTGHRQLFGQVSAAIARVVPLPDLPWISFGYVEADERGSMNMMLAAAPHAEVIHGPLDFQLSLSDMSDRPPVVAPEVDVHHIGGHRLRFIAPSHVPHNRESGLWFDETTSTLLAGDLFTHVGQCPALTESDLIEPALAAAAIFGSTGRSANFPQVLEDLAQLQPTTMALMHGASYRGDGAAQLRALSDGCAAMRA
jgi:flavorubredoxin